MDSYTITKLYHGALLKWWKNIKEEPPVCRIKDIPIESLFMTIFKFYPISKVILLASDGRICCVSSMKDEAPSSFRIRRYMKIDNRTSISSITNVVHVLYQLLSIDPEDTSWLDAIGIVSFISMLLSENGGIEFIGSECIHAMKRQLFNGPDSFVEEEREYWKKEIRDPILHSFYEDSASTQLQQHELVLQRMNDTYTMVQRILQIIDLHSERMDNIEETLTAFFCSEEKEKKKEEHP